MSFVNLTINDKPVSVPKGTTILEAAKSVNIKIPSLCHLHINEINMVNNCASCRVCMVSSDKGLVPACGTLVKEGMSTRDTEAYVKKLLTPGKKKEKEEKPKNASEEAVYRRYEENLKRCLGTKVSIQRKDGNKGKIEIEYYSSDEFERLMELLWVPFN